MWIPPPPPPHSEPQFKILFDKAFPWGLAGYGRSGFKPRQANFLETKELHTEIGTNANFLIRRLYQPGHSQDVTNQSPSR